MKINVEKGKVIHFFVRVRGPKGFRELRAVLDTGSTQCAISPVDAREIGYDCFFDPLANKGEGTLAMTQAGILDVLQLTIEEIQVADISVKNVKTLAYELPKMSGIDMVLGLNFIDNFKTSIDYASGCLMIENIK